MKLFIGGAGNGQRELAAKETGLTPVSCTPDAALTAPIIDNFHLTVRELLQSGGDAKAFAQRLAAENPNAVIICDEIGLGIVVGAGVLFIGILVYNFAVRLIPFAMKMLAKLLGLAFRKGKDGFAALKGLCDSI